MAPARELYKTKLCHLYQRGSCPRQSCSFAHGDAELRRFSGGGSFNGRRYHRGNDLRDRLHRRRSPLRSRYDERQGRSNRRSSPNSKGHSLSPSLDRRSPSSQRSPTRKRGTKRLHSATDAHYSDSGESLRTGDHHDLRDTRSNSPSSSPIDSIEDELRAVEADIEALSYDKLELEVCLKENSEENEKWSNQNKDLESKLSDARTDFKRLGSKLKRLIKVYMRQTRAQEEMSRAQAKLQKMVDELPLEEDNRPTMCAENSDVNIVSDGEPEGVHDGPHPLKNAGGEGDSHQVAIGMIDESDAAAAGKSRKIGGARKKVPLLPEEVVKTAISLQSNEPETRIQEPDIEDSGNSRFQNSKRLTEALPRSETKITGGWIKTHNFAADVFEKFLNPPLEKYKGEDEDIDVEAIDTDLPMTNGENQHENSEFALR